MTPPPFSVIVASISTAKTLIGNEKKGQLERYKCSPKKRVAVAMPLCEGLRRALLLPCPSSTPFPERQGSERTRAPRAVSNLLCRPFFQQITTGINAGIAD